MRKFIIPMAAIIVAGGAFIAIAQQTPAEKTAPVPAQNASAAAEAAPKNIVTKPDTTRKVESYLIKDAPLKTDFVLGKRNAPIVIVEYASLSCPHCAHFAKEELPKLQQKYIDTGKVAYVLRQFPLNAPALTGAMLVHCVGEKSEEQYYTFSHVLFDAQEKWAFDANYETSLQTIAAVGGVDAGTYKTCINKDNETEILKLKKLAIDELTIPHTPYFYINGYAYEGAKTVDEMSKVIDAQLAKK